MIELRIIKTQGSFTLDISLAAPSREVIGLVGPSGSGKSTLLSCIAGHTRPDVGSIKLGDRVLFDSAQRIDEPPSRRSIGMVFQDALLFPHMRVMGNLLYGARSADAALRERVVDALDLSDLLRRKPGSLSGGERQRVALGRALLARPRLLLLDEPLASLDPARADAALDLLAALHDELGIAMLYVSHAQEEISRLADRVVVLGQGAVVDVRDQATLKPERRARPSAYTSPTQPRRRRLGGWRRRA